MKKFRPISGNVEIKPLEKSKVILSEDKDYIDAGEIVLMSPVDIKNTKLKIGDVIFFEAYGCYITTDEVDGHKHYLVPIDSKIVKGVYGE